MKKTELLDRVSKKCGYQKYVCERIIDAMRDVVEDALVDGDDVIIRGFISIKQTGIKGRKGYNPMTGEIEEFKPVKGIRCKISENIKAAVNNVENVDK